MRHHRIAIFALTLLVAALPGSVFAEQVWTVVGGTATIQPRGDVLGAHEVALQRQGRPNRAQRDGDAVVFPLLRNPNLLVLIDNGGQVTPLFDYVDLAGGIVFSTTSGDYTFLDVALDPGDNPAATRLDPDYPSLRLQGIKVGFDRVNELVILYAEDARVPRALAEAIGQPELTDRSVGSVRFEFIVEWTGGDEPATPSPDAGQGSAVVAAAGGDMVFCQLYDLSQKGRVGDTVGLALATTSWNIGNANLLWFQNPDERHPFIAQNVYRLMDDRFEQIGQSWIKHAFCALDNSQCTTACQGTGCTTLGVGCTDTYGSGLNANRTYIGPRYEINPWTGGYTFPGSYLDSSPGPFDAIENRLQVRDSDLDAAQNPGAQYLAEGYYVILDDINVMNSAAYKFVTFSGSPGGTWSIGMSGSGVLPVQQFAINAWSGARLTTLAQDVPPIEFVSPDGRCVLAAKVTDLGNGTWHYEYALMNIDMDRKVGSFSIPVTPGTALTNIGFHAVFSHNDVPPVGPPFDNVAWTATEANGALTWETITNNPLRWGTLYNFRFDANVAPQDTTATLGLFDPGSPATVAGTTDGPMLGPADCNLNTVPDICEIDCFALGCDVVCGGAACNSPCGTGLDCDGDQVLDACEPDCNTNGVADDCDIADVTSDDCQPNGIPDECDPDADGDGVPDACDICLGGNDLADADGDGVPDACDQCPGFNDALDADADMVPDDCDNCPNEFNPTQSDVDLDNIGDACDPDFCDPAPANEHFAADPGWTVVSAGAVDGQWDWGDPAGFGDRWDPPDDFDVNGSCYLTDNVDGNSDVDDGGTRLLSPLYDLSNGANVTLSYAYWIGTSQAAPGDTLVVEASGDMGANWIQLASYENDVQAWLTETIVLDAVMTLTANTQFRFTATDGGTPTVMEAGLDAFEITVDCGVECTVPQDCTIVDLCMTADCVGNACVFSPVVCTGTPPPCMELVCNPADGLCLPQPLPAATACDDGDPCTESDVCDGLGNCDGSPKDCSGAADACNLGVCNGVTGACESQPTNENGPCSDGNFCTAGDFCQGGVCIAGTPASCTKLDDQCNVGVCDPLTGNCNAQPTNESQPCDDGNACTAGETCARGTCTGGLLTPCDGIACADCNANGILDACDIAMCAGDPACEDCNGNAIPDGCEPDCQPNMIPDDCDIAGVTSTDVDSNGIPDECETPDAPIVIAVGARYLSVTPAPDPRVVALRVRSNAAQVIAGVPCYSKFIDRDSATLVETPVYFTPAEWGTVTVTGPGIAPRTQYDVETTVLAGQTSFIASAITSFWGDVNGDEVPNFADIFLVVNGFQGDFTNVTLQAADLNPCAPNGDINFGDIFSAVQAFQGVSFAAICPLPCDAPPTD